MSGNNYSKISFLESAYLAVCDIVSFKSTVMLCFEKMRNSKECPNWNVLIYKQDGWNHMNWGRCKYEFWWEWLNLMTSFNSHICIYKRDNIWNIIYLIPIILTLSLFFKFDFIKWIILPALVIFIKFIISNLVLLMFILSAIFFNLFIDFVFNAWCAEISGNLWRPKTKPLKKIQNALSSIFNSRTYSFIMELNAWIIWLLWMGIGLASWFLTLSLSYNKIF